MKTFLIRSALSAFLVVTAGLKGTLRSIMRVTRPPILSGPRPLALAALLIVGFGSPEASAGLVVGNLGGRNNTPLFVSASNLRQASQFTLGSSFTPSTLDSITLQLSTITAGTSNPGVELWSDSSGTPGSVLVDLGTVPVIGTTAANYTFTPLSTFILQPSSAYWVVFRNSTTPSVGWTPTITQTLDAGSDPSANIPLVRLISTDSGSSWTTSSTTQSFKFAVNATTVPEPSSLALAVLGIGSIGVVVLRRRVRPTIA